MNKIECTVRFLTPAFLGDANQNGAWRTPPFKAQLRQFWRMVMASKGKQYDDIRRIEAHLFGHAWLEGEDPRKSRVRLRLSTWQRGSLSKVTPQVGSIRNGKDKNGKDRFIDGGVYLGYETGPYAKDTKPAIAAGSSATLKIGWRGDENGSPEGAAALLPALALMNRYGTIGGRSRNGWGSYVLQSDALPPMDDKSCYVDWRDALGTPWVQGIGCDGSNPLVWQTAPGKDWRAVIKQLAQLRSDLNRHFGASNERSLLSYPITNKSVSGWNKNDRLPNSLRFKVVEEQGQLYGLVFHMPCRPKDDLWGEHPYSRVQDGLENLWSGVHAELNNNHNELQRVDA